MNGEGQIQYVSNFNELISTPFHDTVNALCWSRELQGDFSELVNKLGTEEGIRVVDMRDLLQLELSAAGQKAREVVVSDLNLLGEMGASPVLNVIRNYERDDASFFFPTDVYSFHVDRSPIPTATFLCTYYGASSDIIPNDHAEQKILIPDVREKLKQLFDGPDESFEDFLSENFFDLHYQAQPKANIISLGIGKLWRLAVDHPESPVLPCIHRAPKENEGEPRLLLIC